VKDACYGLKLTAEMCDMHPAAATDAEMQQQQRASVSADSM